MADGSHADGGHAGGGQPALCGEAVAQLSARELLRLSDAQVAAMLTAAMLKGSHAGGHAGAEPLPPTLALEAFHLDASALVRLVLLVQAVALPGALAIGWLSGRIGRPAALGLCLAGWVAVLVLAWFVQTPAQLTALAVLLALVLGGVQSVIRATVAVLAPPGRAGVTFGIMQVGTKLAGFVAGLLFGGAFAVLGHPRGGLLTLLAQVLLGWWFLARGQASPSTSRIE